MQHQIDGSSIDVKVKNSGVLSTVLRIDSNLRLGVNNTAPDEALDVTGNIKSSGTAVINSTTESETISTGSIVAKGGLGIAKNIWAGGTLNVAVGNYALDALPSYIIRIV